MTYVEMLDLRNVGFMIKVLASLSSIAKLLMTDIPCTRSCKSPVLQLKLANVYESIFLNDRRRNTLSKYRMER